MSYPAHKHTYITGYAVLSESRWNKNTFTGSNFGTAAAPLYPSRAIDAQNGIERSFIGIEQVTPAAETNGKVTAGGKRVLAFTR